MKTIEIQHLINLQVVKFELDFSAPPLEDTRGKRKNCKINIPKINYHPKPCEIPAPPIIKNNSKKNSVQDLVDQLLEDLYSNQHQDWCSSSDRYYRAGSVSAGSLISSQSVCGDKNDAIERNFLETLHTSELSEELDELKHRLRATGERLGRSVWARDRLRRQQKRLCAAFNVLLRLISGDSGARFSVVPAPGAGEGCGEGGYGDWLHAMRLVARLPAGVPQHFRKKAYSSMTSAGCNKSCSLSVVGWFRCLGGSPNMRIFHPPCLGKDVKLLVTVEISNNLWLTLAERYVVSRGVDWPAAERACFRGTAQPDDAELGAQILKDLHRTGCSLFCGTEGIENQGMLRRVLLAYARWNKDVGYCQGFNMLAAIILEVMDKSESDSLKVMIYLVEAVLPEGYFADDLRGLSADMGAFRDLLRLRLPKLAKHMDYLQRMSDDGGVEPPLPDVFTMQWFLTLYATWLPRESLLRVWDLVLLDGNEVLLLTALAIWDLLQDRILSARSADEYYSCMGGGAGAVWAAGDALVARVVALGTAPELPRLRHIHRYRVSPPAPPPTQAPSCQPPLHATVQNVTKKGLRLFYSDDEGDSSDDGNKMALATVIPRRDERIGAGERLSLDIGALKRQYVRLRERQRQAHVILAAAYARHATVGASTSPTSLTVNNLLLGKSAIVSTRGRRLGPPPGAIPPSRHSSKSNVQSQKETHTTETINWKDEKNKKYLNRRNSTKLKGMTKDNNSILVNRKASIDFDETGDGTIVSETEANEMIASLRSRSSSESSSCSSNLRSSTDTSLCDERESESETDIPLDDINQLNTSKEHVKDITNIERVVTPDNDIASKNNLACASNNSIVDYIDTDAGESLRTYISEFQNKQSSDVDEDSVKLMISLDDQSNEEINEELSNASGHFSQNYDLTSHSGLPNSPKQFQALSPVSISPCKIRVSPIDYRNFTYDHNLTSSPSIQSARSPDIIDSLVKYSDFVPDLDILEKTTSDFESPPRSPGADSIVVSEDEPLIPLKIDKYFEHSPEFFGARITVTDPNNPDIPNRRATKRVIRIPKKPDSLTLQSNHNDNLAIHNEFDRASSLPKTHDYSKTYTQFVKNESLTSLSIPRDDRESKNITEAISFDKDKKHGTEYVQKDKWLQENLLDNRKTELEQDEKIKADTYSNLIETTNAIKPDIITSKMCVEKDLTREFAASCGRKNSERALQIIQENSKILSRILTKQSICDGSTTTDTSQSDSKTVNIKLGSSNNEKFTSELENLPDASLLKESASDSIIGCSKLTGDKYNFLRIRPISLDDPFSLETAKIVVDNEDPIKKIVKSPSTESVVTKSGRYGWENKGYFAKCDYQNFLEKSDEKCNYNLDTQNEFSNIEQSLNVKRLTVTEKSDNPISISTASNQSATLPLSEFRESSIYDHKYTSDDYNYPLSSKYNDFVLSKASDICSKTINLSPKVCDRVSNVDSSQASEFAHIVTSSISFTYDPSAEDDSPIGAKSNSSDTLCQIASLDQVSTPISPKIFPSKDTPTLSKEFLDRSDRVKFESDDTCSAITSLIDTDTISSLSYPRSPSTGSYHPFPARPAIRLPKELGVRLGMYAKESINSPSK